MDEKQEQEMIEKGLRYRPTIRSAVTYIIDENGNEIEQPLSPPNPPLEKGGEGGFEPKEE